MRRTIANPTEVETPLIRFGPDREEEVLEFLSGLVGQSASLVVLHRPEQLYVRYEPGRGYLTQAELALTEVALDQLASLMARGLYPLVSDLSGRAREVGGSQTECCHYSAALVFNQVLDARFERVKGKLIRVNNGQILSVAGSIGYSGDALAAYKAARLCLPKESHLIEAVVYQYRLDVRVSIPAPPVICAHSGHHYHKAIRFVVGLNYSRAIADPFLCFDEHYGYPSEDNQEGRRWSQRNRLLHALKTLGEVDTNASVRWQRLQAQMIPDRSQHGSLVSWLTRLRGTTMGAEDFHRIVLEAQSGSAYDLVRGLARLGYDARTLRRRRNMETIASGFYTGRLRLPVY